MAQPANRLLAHRVARCPHCGQPHRFALEIGPREGPLLFAGGHQVTVDLLCPRTRLTFPGEISIGTNEQFLRIADPFATAPPPPADEEFVEWVKGSRQAATDYSRALLTAASAAIPIHFSVLKYLGMATGSGIGGKLAAAPAALYLVAAVTFALAQRPRLVHATNESFMELRAATLRRANRLATAGTTLFLTGTAGSLAAFAARFW